MAHEISSLMGRRQFLDVTCTDERYLVSPVAKVSSDEPEDFADMGLEWTIIMCGVGIGRKSPV